MQEDIRESCDGGIPKVVVGCPRSAGRDAVGSGQPATRTGEFTATQRASGAPGVPIDRKRVAPTVHLPNHNKCHTARSPSMGRIGTIQDEQVIWSRAATVSAHDPHTSFDRPATPVLRRQVPSPGCQTGHPNRAAGLRDRLAACASTIAWRRCFFLSESWRNRRTDERAYQAPTPLPMTHLHAIPHHWRLCGPAPSALRQTCTAHCRASPGDAVQQALPADRHRAMDTLRPFPSPDTV
jgi:hypothetical protein